MGPGTTAQLPLDALAPHKIPGVVEPSITIMWLAMQLLSSLEAMPVTDWPAIPAKAIQQLVDTLRAVGDQYEELLTRVVDEPTDPTAMGGRLARPGVWVVDQRAVRDPRTGYPGLSFIPVGVRMRLSEQQLAGVFHRNRSALSPNETTGSACLLCSADSQAVPLLGEWQVRSERCHFFGLDIGNPNERGVTSIVFNLLTGEVELYTWSGPGQTTAELYLALHKEGQPRRAMLYIGDPDELLGRPGSQALLARAVDALAAHLENQLARVIERTGATKYAPAD